MLFPIGDRWWVLNCKITDHVTSRLLTFLGYIIGFFTLICNILSALTFLTGFVALIFYKCDELRGEESFLNDTNSTIFKVASFDEHEKEVLYKYCEPTRGCEFSIE